MKRLGLIVTLLMSLVAAPLAVAEPASNDMAARIELHAINTMTLSDAQFLTGDANGKATVTTGQLRIAAGSGRLPVVVLQHGSGGMAANTDLWEREFNAMGVSTFALDGFTGRGLMQVNTDQALLGRLNFILDIYRSLDVLAKHPRVDVPSSKLKVEVARILKEEGYIANYKVVEEQKGKKTLRVFLRYTQDRRSVITNLKRSCV